MTNYEKYKDEIDKIWNEGKIIGVTEDCKLTSCDKILHCNECDWDDEELISLFKGWNIYYSYGETREDIRLR